MDSGNSDSIQSSSSGDEEYDSKYKGSISTFLNSSTPFCSSPLPQFLLNQYEPMKFFDNPQDSQNFNSNIFLDSPNSSSYYNNDLISLTSDPIYNNFGNFTHQSPYHDSTLTTTTKTKSSNIDNNKSNDHVMKKKRRRRATRRAPTTVLTTDTTNFRQMVQEFTGIPTTPFTGPAYSCRGRRRLDLLSSTATSAIRSSSHLDNFEHLFTLRPLTSTQNVQNMIPSTLVMPNDSIVSATTTIIPSLDELGMCTTSCNSQHIGGYI